MQVSVPAPRWRAAVRPESLRGLLSNPNVLTGVALAAIVIAGLVLRLVWWYGLVNVDPFAYADAAASIARGKPVFDPDIVGNLYYTQYLRLSLIVPAAALFGVFGPGEAAAAAFPIVCSLATAVVAFAMALQAGGGRVAALIAAFITAVFPLSVINSTQFLPDTVMVFWASLTILLLWRGLLETERSWRYRAALFAAVGLTWALAFYGRQTAVGLAIPLAALVLYYRRFDTAMVGGIAGALLVWAAMTAVVMLNGGHFLEDVRTVINEGRGSQPGALGYTDLDFSYVRTFRKDNMFVPFTGLAMLGCLGIALSWRAPGLRRRELIALAIIIVGLFLYFEFLMRLPSLYSWWKEPRYVLTLVAPVAALTGIGFARMLFDLQPRKWLAYAAVGGLLVVMLGSSIREIRRDHAFWEANRVDAAAREIASVLEDRDEQVVYIWNDDLARYLSFSVGLDRTTVYERANGEGYLQNRFDADGYSRVTPGSLVITTAGQADWFRTTAAAEHWQRIWADAAGTAIWGVPEQPPAVATQPKDVTLDGGLRITGAGVANSALLPRRHTVLTLVVDNAEPLATLLVGTSCGAVTTMSRTLAVPAGDAVLSVDLPLPEGGECSVVAGLEGGAPQAILPLEIGKAVAIEPELAFSHDPDHERQLGSAWFRVDQPFFSGGGSAVALEPFEPLVLEPGHVEAGEYWVVLAAYDYGTGGTNRVRVSLNGATSEISWGSTGEAGVVNRVVRLANVPAGGELVVAVLDLEQDGITIDSVVVSSVEPPER